MRCPKCGAVVGIDIIEHIRTNCKLREKKEKKQTDKVSGQMPFWPTKQNNSIKGVQDE